MKSSLPTYDEKFFEPLQAIEERHFWFRSRNQLIGNLIEKYVSDTAETSTLGMEIGCGTGNVLKYLHDRLPNQRIVGVDLYQEGLKFAALRGNPYLIQADIYHPPFLTGFSWIGLFDILEHLDEDEEILKSIGALLQDEGLIFISVPAFPVLWSYFDLAGKHKRRYTAQSLSAVCQQAGLEVVFTSYTHLLIFPMVWIVRSLFQLGKKPETLSEERVTQKTHSELRIIPLVNSLLTFILGLEGRLIKAGVRMPFGTSLIGIVKPNR